MKIRDFLRLPLGEYLLTDGIYKQHLYVCQADDGGVFYRIIEAGGAQWNSVALFPERVDVYEDDDWKGGKHFYMTLRGLSSAAGLAVHGECSIYSLKFIGRFSKDWKEQLNPFYMHDRISNRREGFYLRKLSVKKKAA